MLRLELVVAGRVAIRVRPHDLRELLERKGGDVGDVVAGKGHRERLQPQTLAVTERALGAFHVLRHASLHRRALGVGERLQHVLAGAGEGAHIARLLLSLERAPHLGGRVAGVHGYGGLLVREEQPVALLFRELAPRLVDVVTHRDENVAQVLSLPRSRPGGDRALADRERIVGNHRPLRHFVHAAESVTARTRALGRVGRERLRLEMLLLRRILSRARVEHAQEIGESGHASHGGARCGRAALLLERDGRRQPVHFVHLGNRHLVEEAARVRRDRFEIAALRLGVERPEGER